MAVRRLCLVSDDAGRSTRRRSGRLGPRRTRAVAKAYAIRRLVTDRLRPWTVRPVRDCAAARRLVLFTDEYRCSAAGGTAAAAADPAGVDDGQAAVRGSGGWIARCGCVGTPTWPRWRVDPHRPAAGAARQTLTARLDAVRTAGSGTIAAEPSFRAVLPLNDGTPSCSRQAALWQASTARR